MKTARLNPWNSRLVDFLQSSAIQGCIKHSESWKVFGIKSLAIAVILYLMGAAFAARYMIVGDPQTVRCIPGYDVYLVDTKDKVPVRGGLFVFLSKDLSPIYKEGTKMLKYLRGMPGDTVEVRQNDQVFINGEASEFGLTLAAEKLGQPASHFHGKAKLKENEYWFLGTSPRSFDSRYWGAVSGEKIVGRAYPLF